MVTISMLEFRKHAKKILQRAQRGERFVLSYRGRPVVRLEPIIDPPLKDEDPFYRLPQLAQKEPEDLTNEQIDRVLYGE